VNRWKAAVALVLAILYLPVTAHCLLEQAGWLPADGDCCEQRASTDGSTPAPCAYGCCLPEHAVYVSPLKRDSSPLTAEVPVWVTALVADVAPKESLTVPPESSPPTVQKVWQFIFRTALPPRAPSLVS